MRILGVLSFLLFGFWTAGAMMAVSNNNAWNDNAFVIGAYGPAIFFLILGFVLNHYASKRQVKKLKEQETK